MTTHRVAVVVFCEVEAELAEDAEVVAARAVAQRLGFPAASVDLSVDAYGHHFPAKAYRVIEAGLAAANGYLWSRPTAKAYREAGR